MKERIGHGGPFNYHQVPIQSRKAKSSGSQSPCLVQNTTALYPHRWNCTEICLELRGLETHTMDMMITESIVCFGGSSDSVSRYRTSGFDDNEMKQGITSRVGVPLTDLPSSSIMPFLDEPKDGHPVGATTFAVRVSPSKVIGNARLNNEPALHLEEVAFTAYYPADPATRRKGMPWLLRWASNSR